MENAHGLTCPPAPAPVLHGLWCGAKTNHLFFPAASVSDGTDKLAMQKKKTQTAKGKGTGGDTPMVGNVVGYIDVSLSNI